MGVTPLTDSLPWWANQGGPTGGPGATPQGGGAASAPAGGAPAGVSQQDWLAYLQQMFGISPAQAQEVNPHGDSPQPVPPQPAPYDPLSSIRPPPVPPAPSPVPSPTNPYSGPLAAADASGHPPPNQFVTGGPELAAARAGHPAAPAPASASQGFMPWRGPLAGDSPANIAAAGGAAGSNATSNPRFTTIDRPNMPAEQRGQARGGVPISTALDLSGMFNRGQGGPNPNAPAQGAQAVSAMRPVAGPLANAPMPPVMPPDIQNQRVRNAINNNGWWRNL